jgi:hypothetical protein
MEQALKEGHQWPDGTPKDGSVCKSDKQLFCEIHAMLKQLLDGDERQSGDPARKHLSMIDITEPNAVEIMIRPDRRVVWINVNGICVLRASRIKELHFSNLERQSENPVSPAGSATPPQVASHGPAGAPPLL